MAQLRRSSLLAAFVLMVIFLFSRVLIGEQQPFSRDHIPSLLSNQAVPSSNDGAYRWNDVPTKYPLHSFIPIPTGQPRRLPPIQHIFKGESALDKSIRLQRRQAVRNAFKRCFDSYWTQACPQDELSPISGGSQNAFGGWAATLVDSLDTLYIMDMKEELDEAVDVIDMLDFATSTEEVFNVFEINIRFLGGFLAAYDLTGQERLLNKAREVGEMLFVAFDTPNHMPVTRWNWAEAWRGQEQEALSSALVSEIGSLSLEFTRLSQLTGDPKWYDAIVRITQVFDLQQNLTKLPGMWPISVDAKNQNFTFDTAFTLGGMSDSLYEYFPKQYALLGEPIYRKLYESSMSVVDKYCFFRPMTPDGGNILISGNSRARSPTDITLEPQGQHLACFSGGMLALGGRLWENAYHVELGRKLVDGCVWAYEALPTGIMPETFHLVACDSRHDCPWNATMYGEAVLEKARDEYPDSSLEEIVATKRLPPGFTDIGDRRYILRPEAIESIFVLYRITGDQKLQEVAWKMFNTIQSLTQTEFANAALDDVTVTEGVPPKSDRMESFWMAETLKYFYLMFSEPDLISLDEYVFNTEAHPFRRPQQ